MVPDGSYGTPAAPTTLRGFLPPTTEGSSTLSARLPRQRHRSCRFGSIVLDEGELPLHDIKPLDNVPDTIVMATCSGGSGRAREGMSLAGAFLGLVAAADPVTIRSGIIRLHRSLPTDLYVTDQQAASMSTAKNLQSVAANPKGVGGNAGDEDGLRASSNRLAASHDSSIGPSGESNTATRRAVSATRISKSIPSVSSIGRTDSGTGWYPRNESNSTP